MKKFITRFLIFFLLSNYFFKTEKIAAFIPYFYLPTIENLERESLIIGKNAYQFLYFGQIKESLNLAKLATKINKQNENLWLILSETQIANKLYEDALNSLIKAEKINPEISEIYFAKSNIYLKQSKVEEAQIAINLGLKLAPQNYNAIFQLGNIYLMKKDYSSALKYFDKAVKIKTDFWQAINNKGLVYFEQDKIDLSIEFFEKAITYEENAESLLGLASCLSLKDINSAITIAKKALIKNPNYVEYNYRKEQLWGEKIQNITKKLLKNDQLKEEIKVAKSKINATN